MTDNHTGFRWAFLAAVLVSIAVGVLAYNAGLSQGAAQIATAESAAAQGAPAPYPYAYGWRPSWGFGYGFSFFPFLMFVFFWIFVSRLFWWGGPWRRGWYGYGPCGGYGRRYDGPTAFDDWHQRAHDRMKDTPKETPSADDPGGGR